MGASRKLQGEIDRVLKKVQEGVDVFDSIWNKVYDTENVNQKEKFEADLKKEIKKLQRYRDQIKTWIQSSEIKDKKALVDARKLIEREMERFKVCEKETKTKAFSKEGLGQQPKTDPKEKAKSETRDWLNNVVGDLESQVDNFEAEVEGLSVKKGKSRPPRLVHLETSITRHKAHIMKLELILRLLDNDELSPEQVNDVKDFIEDYIERNQEDFDEFEDVDELYSSLPLEKVEALEDQFSLGPSSLVKGVGSISTPSAVSGLKNSVGSSPIQIPPSPSTASQTTAQESEETTSQDSNTDAIPKTPSPKVGTNVSVTSTPIPVLTSGITAGSNLAATAAIPARPLGAGPTAAMIISSPSSTRIVAENSIAVFSPSLVSSPSAIKDDDTMSFPARKPSPAIPEVGLVRGINRGISNQSSIGSSATLSSAGALGDSAFSSATTVSDFAKGNMLNIDERSGSSVSGQSFPSSNRIMLQQMSRNADGTVASDNNNSGDAAAIGGRSFSPSIVSGSQWRPQSAASFQNLIETGHLRGRAEITPDIREKYQQWYQQGHSNFLSVSHLSEANQKMPTSQPQNSLLLQFNSQNSSISPQVGIGLGLQGAGFTTTPSTLHQQSSQHSLMPSLTKDVGLTVVEEQTQMNLSDELISEHSKSPGPNKIIRDDDLRTAYAGTGSASVAEGTQLTIENDLLPGQPLQSSQPSASLGVIGRRSVSDLGAIGDNLGGSAGSSGGTRDQIYNLQLLEAAYHKLPQAKDSERVNNYVPGHPAVTPASYPQSQASIVNNPALWGRFGLDSLGADALFFAFYYQPNTYQQYLAARELKKQSWRYHKQFNTWFQRHEEPKITNDNFESGSYVYFDFRIAEETPQHGWCQRIRTDFTFEYDFLEDELVV